MGEDKRELNEQLDRLEDELPEPAAKPVSKLRRPDWKWVRLPAGILLLISGFISTTPALNSRFAAGWRYSQSTYRSCASRRRA